LLLAAAAAAQVDQRQARTDKLAGAIAAASSNQQRQGLLEANKELVSADLNRALISELRRLENNGTYTETLGICEIVRDLARQINDRASLAIALEGIGNAHVREGRRTEALPYYQEALKLARELGDTSLAALTLDDIGLVYNSQGDFSRALDFFQNSLALKEQIGNRREIALSLNRIGVIYATKGDYPGALDLYQKSLAIWQETNDKRGMADVLSNIGNVRYSRGDYALALEYHNKSLALREQIGDKRGIAASLNNIGNVHDVKGDYAVALDYQRRSLSLKQDLGDKQGMANTLNNIGNILRSQGSYQQALENFSKSLALKRELGDKYGMALTLTNIGTVYNSQGDYEQALEFYQESLERRNDLGDRAGAAIVLNNIGAVYAARGNYALALDYHHKSLAIKLQVGDKRGIGMTLTNIGNVYNSQGDYPQALEYYNKSLALKNELGDKAGIALVLNNIGDVRNSEGNYALSLDLYQQSLALRNEIGDKQGAASTLANIGRAYQSLGNYERALAFYEQSLRISEDLGDKPGIADVLAARGEVCYLRADFSQAIDLEDRAASIAAQIGLSETRSYSLTTAGKAYKALNKRDLARKAFEDAIAAIERVRGTIVGGERQQERYFREKVSPYYEIVDLLIDQHDPAQALIYAERARGRVLLDVLENGRVNVTKAMSSSEIARDRELNSRLVSCETEIARLKLRPDPDESSLAALNDRMNRVRLEYEAFYAGLYAAHPELEIQRGRSAPLTPDGLNTFSQSAPNTAFLEYVVTDKRIILFVIAREHTNGGSSLTVRAFQLPVPARNLTTMVDDFRKLVAERNLAIKGKATALYNILVAPVRNTLGNVSSLCILPDGPLWQLPFQALYSASHGYLLESYSIYYAHSLTALEHAGKKSEGAGRSLDRSPVNRPELFAVGNPALDDEAITRLGTISRAQALAPGADEEREVQALARIYGPANSRILIRDQAREETVKADAANYRIIHVAAHSVLDDRSPMYSGLILSRAGREEDGVLEAWEIMKLDLKAELVVLSGCETARGQVSAGEGIIGINWAFFIAGVPSTVVSQWNVDSAATADLMIEFHKRLAGRSAPTKAEALRQAELTLLRGRYRHPVYWAGFVLMGDGR
jgi:CHAT domain-containing protein/tetratricopeptide (TPR) repeat protein